MVFAVEQALVLVLAVDIHQQFRKPAQKSQRHNHAANTADIALGGGDFALDAQQAALCDKLLLPEGFSGLGAVGNIDQRLHGRAVAPRANQPAIGAPAQNQIDAVHNDGLAGARFTAKHMHAAVKVDLQVFDQRDIAHGHRHEHGSHVPFVSLWVVSASAR